MLRITLILILICATSRVAKAEDTEINASGKIGEELSLSQDKHPFAYWFKSQSLDQPAFIGYDANDLTDAGRYEIKRTENFPMLTIKKTRLDDIGYSSYFARLSNKTSNERAVFNIFLYNSESKKAMLYVNSKPHPLDKDENEIDIEVQSFNVETPIKIEYQVQALPLSKLIADGEQINSNVNECFDSSEEKTKCLKGDLTSKLSLEDCSKQIQYALTYGFDDEERYPDDIKEKKVFKTKLNIKFPPKTIRQSETWINVDFEREKELTCKVKCGNPSDKYTFEWSLSNGDLLDSKTNTLKFIPKDVSGFSIGSDAKILCTVKNDVDATQEFLSESQTEFLLRFKSPTTTATTTTATTTTTTTTTTTAAETTPGASTGESTLTSTPGSTTTSNSGQSSFGFKLNNHLLLFANLFFLSYSVLYNYAF